MDVKEIIELIHAVAEADIKNFQLQEGEFSLSIDKIEERVQINSDASKESFYDTFSIKEAEETLAATLEEKKIKTITSPIVGTFYRSPGENKDYFVEVHDQIKKGQVLCMIEAMKLMNNIESEVDGEVVEILVEDGSMVQYHQPIFKIRVEE